MANRGGFRWGTWLTVLILAGAAVGAGWWYLKNRRETPPEYQTAAVTRGAVTQVVTATGQLDPVINVAVGSQISGLIQKLYVDFNSTVKSNQIIAEIDPITYKMNLLKAEADLANARANMNLAKVQANRSSALFSNKLVSASDNDVAQAQLEQAQAQVQSSEALRENVKVDLAHCTIYAPVDGVVISRNVDVGQTVAASFNTPTLFSIANNLAKMQIDALVSEADIGGVAVGQTVNFTVDAYPYRTFTGSLSQVRYGSITNQNVINYDCVVAVSNADLKLLPGMTANVSIILDERANVLRVPNAALRFHPPDMTNTLPQFAPQGARPATNGVARGGAASPAASPFTPDPGRMQPERRTTRTVYVLPPKPADAPADPPKPKPVQIQVGITDGSVTEVLAGLHEGDQIVTGMVDNSASRSGGPPSNPFGGGPRRF
jgi:HlyD family secretion protein